MSFLLKDPDAVLDYLVDWGAEYLGIDVLTTSDWSVEPDEPGGVRTASAIYESFLNQVVIPSSGRNLPLREIQWCDAPF